MVFKDRPTIAFLRSESNYWYFNTLTVGAVAACREYKVNLRIFYGAELEHPILNLQGREEIFKLAGPENADGIVSLTGGVAGFLDQKGIDAYFQRFTTLPLVSIGTPVTGCPVITVDNEEGMISMVSHLIEAHGYRKILFLGGTAGNEEAGIRLGAYKKALTDHDIAIDDSLILRGDFNWTISKEVIHAFMEGGHRDIKAIVCANDMMAAAVYHELKARRISIPGDIGVTGFDDVPHTAHTTPPLTTVRQPLFEQGYQAVKMVLKMLKGEKVPDKLVLPCSLSIRESCGCTEEYKQIMAREAIQAASKTSGEHGDSAGQDEELLLRAIAERYRFNDTKKEQVSRLHTLLTAHLEQETRADRPAVLPKENPSFTQNNFAGGLSKIILHENISAEELNQWNAVVKWMAAHYMEKTADILVRKELELIVLHSEKMLAKIEEDSKKKKDSTGPINIWEDNVFLNILVGCLRFEDIMGRITEIFNRSGLAHTYLILFTREDTKSSPIFEPCDEPTPRSRLFLGFEEGKSVYHTEGIEFSTARLLPEKKLSFTSDTILSLYPLCFNQRFFGYVIFEYAQDQAAFVSDFINIIRSAFENISHYNAVKKVNLELDDLNKSLEQKVLQRTTELEKANEKLKELDRAKTDFFANVSHELRTPLTLILSPLESILAGDYGTFIENSDTIFNAMHTNSLRLLRLINNLLDFSKISAGKMQLTKKTTNLAKLLHFYITSIHSGIQSKGLQVEFNCDTPNILVSLDRDLLEKAFFNLISNAIKFSRRGGMITVTLELKQEKSEVLIGVADRGIGIPPEKIESVFDRFTQVEQSSTRKYEGTGIGLALTREIVELHGGTIGVESTLGEGSVFTIRLPYSGPAELPASPEQEEFHEIKNWMADEFAEAIKAGMPVSPVKMETSDPEKQREAALLGRPNVRLNKPTILVVDDNDSMRDFITGLLHKRYKAMTAVNGKDALEVVRSQKPDLIISDVMMPEIDGLELCCLLKENRETAKIPIILLTARMDIATRLEGLENRADDYLIKPFNARELFARIRNLLEKRQLERHLEGLNAALWSEMETAKKIQESLVPASPVIPGFELACYLKSAGEVSGDYFDVINSGSKSYLVIGDVSGHGVTAGLVMMMVQTALHLLIAQNPDITPSSLLSGINRTIKNNLDKLDLDKFMTINLFVHVKEGHFLFAGLHQDIFIYRAAYPSNEAQRNDQGRAERGTVQVLQTKGMWLAMMDDISHLMEDASLELKKGDILLLYTDGITEAAKKDQVRGKHKERFGEEKLKRLLESHGHKGPEEVKKAICNELENYICDDDFTFVIVKRS